MNEMWQLVALWLLITSIIFAAGTLFMLFAGIIV